MELTERQSEVVHASRGNLLISAAAGSGKTSVMTERIASRIKAQELDIRRVLVMTFTSAAASHMSTKIEKSLTEKMLSESDPSIQSYLSEQITFLPLAQISTIHAFCLSVIHNFGYDAKTDGEADVEPGFVTLDTALTSILFRDSLHEVFTELYDFCYQIGHEKAKDKGKLVLRSDRESINEASPYLLLDEQITWGQWCEDFLRMVESLGDIRTDEKLYSDMTDIHSYLRSLPDYKAWVLTKLEEQKETTLHFETSLAARVLMSDFLTALSLAEKALPYLEAVLPEMVFVRNRNNNDGYIDFFASWFQLIKEMIADCVNKCLSWDRCYEYSTRAPEGRFPRMPDNDDAKAKFNSDMLPVFEVIFYLTGKVPKKVISLFSTSAHYLFARKAAQIEEETAYMFPVVKRFFEVIMLADERYAQKKREQNGIDFSDYEHLALRLLARPDAQKYYSERFDEIYIDEYQDNSRIQDAIVASFSRDNVFFVGDVKQSIYRFRHARPELFMERLEKYREKLQGTLLELNSNFRSRPEILEAVNIIFSAILSKDSGEIDYDESHLLTPMREPANKNEDEYAVSLILIDRTSVLHEEQQEEESQEEEREPDSDESADSAEKQMNEELDEAQKQAVLVAQKMQMIMKAEEGAKWSDFAVLTRTNSEAARISRILVESGIPSAGPAQNEFFANRELLLMENFMRLLDNFRQDIPLAAVMRAPFPQASFSEDEMLDIFLFAREKYTDFDPYYSKVLHYRDNGTDPVLLGKTKGFCDFIEALRSETMYMRVSEIISRIYALTAYPEYVQTEDNGDLRLAALNTFRDWASRFDKGQNGGLYRFVRYIEDMEDKDQTPEDFTLAAGEQDAVSCMSIHKSKGLEFKYVFITGISSQFRGKSKKSGLMLSERFGIGSDYIRPTEGYRFETLQKTAVSTCESRAELAEHMRVLYVAMTRAEEKLYLIGSFKRNKNNELSRLADIISQARKEKAGFLPPWLVYKAKSYQDLILMGLARYENIDMNPMLSDNCESNTVRGPIDFQIISEGSLIAKPFLPEKKCYTGKKDTAYRAEISELTIEEMKRLNRQISGDYAFMDKTMMPSKTTVSELKRREEDNDLDREVYPIFGEYKQEADDRPLNFAVHVRNDRLISDKKLSPAERGTLLHSVFQYLDFPSVDMSCGQSGVSLAIEKLVFHNMILPEQGKEIEPYYSSILTFASSSICRRMNEASKRPECGPFREMPFSLAIPTGDEDVSLVQGMIDCWFVEDEYAVLIDYKSDHISGTKEQKEEVLRKRYSLQMDYYAQAISAAGRIPVKEKIIWLIPDGLSFLL